MFTCRMGNVCLIISCEAYTCLMGLTDQAGRFINYDDLIENVFPLYPVCNCLTNENDKN